MKICLQLTRHGQGHRLKHRPRWSIVHVSIINIVGTRPMGFLICILYVRPTRQQKKKERIANLPFLVLSLLFFFFLSFFTKKIFLRSGTSTYTNHRAFSLVCIELKIAFCIFIAFVSSCLSIHCLYFVSHSFISWFFIDKSFLVSPIRPLNRKENRQNG